MSINLSYTFTQSRDLAGGLVGVGGGFGGGGGATTAGNPNIPEWGRSDLERRHAFLAVLSIPVHPAFDFSVISRLTSGGHFTPLVSGDINGDGVRNDRAFIFDPASAPDTAIGNGMARLLATGHPRAEDCLRNQFGKIAGRNSCSIPWSPGLDFQANIRPDFLGLSRRLTLSVLGVNTLTGIDRLLHGADNLRGWVQPVITDRTLLYVRGFDPVAQRFLYQVNEHFGTATGTKSAYRVPFQISVQGRLAIGTDPARQQMDALLGGVTGRVSERTAIFRDRLARSVPNVYRNILELNDSLHLELTPDQQAQLKIGGDSLQAKADTLIDALAQALGTTDRNENPMKLMLKMRDKVQEGRALGQKAVAESQKILSPEQWVKPPKYVREIGPDRESGEERRRPPGR